MIKNLKQKIKNRFSYSLLSEDDNTDYFSKPCPEDNATLWQRFTFGWTERMLMTGYFNGPLEMKDVSDLPDRNKVNITAPFLDTIDYNSKYPLIKQIYKEFVSRNKISVATKIFVAIVSILSPLCLKYFIYYIKLDESQKTFKFGFLLCVLLFLSSLSLTLSQQYGYWFGLQTSLHARGAITQKIFEKTLRLSNQAKRLYNSGTIMNIISVDVGTFSDFFWNNHIEIFVFPFQILALLILLCWIVGLSGLVGFGVMVVSIPLCTFLSTKIAKNLRISLGYADTRCNLTSEFINGIRFLKLYAWEQLFLDRIEEQRTLQLKYLYRRAIYWILDRMITQVTSALVLVATFSTYALTGNQMTLEVAFTAMTIFVNLRRPLEMLPEAIHRALSLIPSSKRIENFLQSPEIQDQPFLEQYSNNKLSIRNNNNNNNNVSSTSSIASSASSNELFDVKINNGTFDWNEIDDLDSGMIINDVRGFAISSDINDMDEMILGDEKVGKSNDTNNGIEYDGAVQPSSSSYVLNNINFIAPAGKLTVICGIVGSGKTSLVSGLIGEIYRVSGSVNIPNNISFTTQQPFLLSTSLRDNILFGKPMNMERYKKVIDACCLTPDLLQLAAKDLTEIGERGINLSGGQKQRISLARALYSDSDCFILDEPLSAVDPEVASHLFDHCIQGMMKDKTRILVTHQLQFIPSADHIIVVDNGVLTQGTYSELKEKGIDFESIMKTKKLNIDENDQSSTSTTDKKSSTSSSSSELKKSTSLLNSTKELDINTIISEKNDPNLIEKAKLLVKEDRNEGEVGFEVYRQYFRHGSLNLFFLTCALYFISQIIFQLSDFWLTIWTNDETNQHDDKYYILYYCIFIGAFIVFLVVRYFMMASITFAASKKLHSELLNSVAFASCQFFDTNPSGRILNRFSKDISDIDLILMENFSDVLQCGSTVVVALFMMIYITPLISIPFAILVVVYYVIQKLYRASSVELKRMESITRSPVFSLLAEAYNGLVTIRCYQQQKRFIEMMQNHININLRLFFYSFSVHRWVGIRLEFITALIVFFTAFSSLFSSNTGFSVLAVTTALGICSYLNWTIRQMTELEVKMNSVERVESYIKTPREGIRHTSEFEDEIDIDGEIEMDFTKWPSRGEVEFKNVEIKYRPTADPSLKNISFKINAKDHIGVVGRTGAGKSTVGISLFRMVECSKGSIFIDGVDISKVGLHELRDALGIVPQDPFIFSGSIRMNIDPFNKYTDDEIWTALEKVKLKDAISSMPLKLESGVQENGDGLSFGQKQLLCLSRTILKNSKVVLMDEATSGIDYVTAALLKQTIDENFNDCTMLTIAHRLDTIIDSTKIAVIDKGELVEYDTPMNLIKTEGSRFKKLVKYQTDFYEESQKKF
ncbi:ABC transporter C family protein [Dictyostelium discoideum AX4]|uniref:ABC transporter C family member 2 n=1 Tax=Dictyostelium discoideum TaxID=44689 RepID=ABCC2_DICDI|nr:ABC transporter C family protein [Dictyostelium discoideum AX4]Q54VJ0.1 RecName: Full=ABC transporter C family member 2; AltName: Full=ABC transporter ABCC.2 [Dictyostelium discoideum]EAL67254.1 ABC transporter C family protein [Dictyostelium discoideum AX4]|eukprot:XP_641365.1 ABC transporter C family protein [Dictyostelium discoideum AX4]